MKLRIFEGLGSLRGSENNNFVLGLAMNTENYAIKIIIFWDIIHHAQSKS
jgi:hypothetical protein